MATITLRSVKGSPLTNNEIDNNFISLNDDKLEVTGTALLSTNLAGGDVGHIPYQTDVNTTAFLPPGTAGYVLTSNGEDPPIWTKGTAGATGGADDKVFWENDQVITANYTITAGKTAGTFGPITVADDITVTIPPGSIWTIV